MKIASFRLIMLYEYLIVPQRFPPSPDQFDSLKIGSKIYAHC